MTIAELIEKLKEYPDYLIVQAEIYDESLYIEYVEYDSHRGVILKLDK